jgi:hypothetical protein
VYRTVTDVPLYGAVVIAYLAVAAFALHDWWARPARHRVPQPLAWLIAFSLLSIGATVVTVTLMTDLPVMPRYLIPAFIWPIIVTGLFLAQLARRHAVAGAAVLAALIAGTLGYDAYRAVRDNGWSVRYYPNDIACMDAALESEGLSHGIAQYWDAKYLQQFSRRDLEIAQFLEHLEEMRWITSERYFRSTYDFAVIDESAEPAYRISTDALARINGAPKRVVACGTRSIHIYGKDALRTLRTGTEP